MNRVGNPLYEVLVWSYENSKDISYDNVKDFLLHAPQYYDIWWRGLLNEAPQHVLIETGLICFIIWLMFIRRTVDPVKPVKDVKFTEKEIMELVDTWEPEPLVPTLSKKSHKVSSNMMIIENVKDNYLELRGQQKPVLNASSFDFYGFSRSLSVKDASSAALDVYGCGSCGPRGFYGTIDQHLKIEHAIADFMGTEEAISYSDGASTVSSAIPAFSKKGDLLIIDDASGEPILTGANLSRSTVYFFKHNDMNDLESLLTSIAADDRRLKRDMTQQRRFIVTEALNRSTGALCPLMRLLEIKRKFCYRLILDESLSFGTIGKTGRGLTEHFGIPITDVEIVTVAMDTALGSVGGLCIGSREVVDHQRLSGAGYCFSASAPPFLSAAAVASLTALQARPALLQKLASNATLLRQGLDKVMGLKLLSADPTAVLHLALDPSLPSREEEEDRLHEIADRCIQHGVGIVVSKFSLVHPNAAKAAMRPSLRVCASAEMTDAELSLIVSEINLAVNPLSTNPAPLPPAIVVDSTPKDVAVTSEGSTLAKSQDAEIENQYFVDTRQPTAAQAAPIKSVSQEVVAEQKTVAGAEAEESTCSCS